MNILAHQNKREIKYGWVVTPKQLGTFAIASVLFYQDQDIAYQAIGLTITNTFGLNLWQAQLLSSIGGFLGAFFGPALTFVWWYDRWKERKAKREEKTKMVATNATNAATTVVVDVWYSQQRQKSRSSKAKRRKNP
jgi:hypothetical protein